MAYQTKDDADRGPIGAWLRRERIERMWRVKEVVAMLAEDPYDIDITESWYRQVESGKAQPGQILLLALTRIFESEPDVAEAEAPADALVAAIEELTREMRALRAALAGAEEPLPSADGSQEEDLEG